MTRNCNNCNKSYSRRPSVIGYYCSKECMGLANYQNGSRKNLTYKISKGTIPWNKGLVGFRAGSEHHNWRGGITALSDAIRSCSKYKTWRLSVYARDSYMCQECKDSGGGNLNADHIKPFSKIIRENKITTLQQAYDCHELWNINNGRTLCETCHIKTPTFGIGALRCA